MNYFLNYLSHSKIPEKSSTLGEVGRFKLELASVNLPK